MAVLDEPNAFSGATLDRAADGRKDPAWVEAQRRHPAARAVLAGTAGGHLATGAQPRLALVPLAAAPAHAPPLLLGLDDAGPVFAVDVDPPGDALPRPLIGAYGSGTPDPATGTRPTGLRDAVAALPQA